MVPTDIDVDVPIEYGLILGFCVRVLDAGNLNGYPNYGDRSRHIIKSIEISNSNNSTKIPVNSQDIDFWLDVVEDEFDDALHEALQSLYNE